MLFLSLALSIPSGEAFIKQSEFKKEILSEMIKNEPFTKSEVNSKDDIQSLNLVGASFHQKTCAQTFSVLGNYENYKNIIGFIKTSTYNESSKKYSF